MNFSERETLMHEMVHSLKPLMEEYDLDEVEIYEEEGENPLFYLGYTVKKGKEVFMIHRPYVKNAKDELALKENKWTIQSVHGESKGYQSIEEVFSHILH